MCGPLLVVLEYHRHRAFVCLCLVYIYVYFVFVPQFWSNNMLLSCLGYDPIFIFSAACAGHKYMSTFIATYRHVYIFFTFSNQTKFLWRPNWYTGKREGPEGQHILLSAAATNTRGLGPYLTFFFFAGPGERASSLSAATPRG